MKAPIFGRNRLFFISPWLLAAAIGLLTLIIFIFAANNIKREKHFLTEGLLLKGREILRFVNASARVSMMMGLQNQQSTQQLLEQAADDQGILYIAVLDQNGLIMAHSDPEMINRTMKRDMPRLHEQLMKKTGYIIDSPSEAGKIFEVVGRLEPLRRDKNLPGENRRQRMLQRRLENKGTAATTQDSVPAGLPDNWWCRLIQGDQTLNRPEYLIIAGLDMTELEKIERQGRYQILFMSLVLLLIGLGGWITLLTAQGYRVSQDTLSHIQAFTGLLISRLPVGIIATDPAGRIKSFNRAAAAMINVDQAAAINRTPAEILPQALALFFTGPQAGEEMEEQEIKLQWEDRDALILRLSSAPIKNLENSPVGRVLLMYDMSKIKELEKEVRRHDRLAALGKMAAGVAHEVRNPLSSIKGFATLLGAKFAPQSKEHEISRLLVAEVERLNRTITELLNFSRPLPLNREALDLTEIIEKSLQMIQPDADEIKVTVSKEIAPGTPKVLADRDRLNQILLNLYLNSLQAMARGGRLAVWAGKGEKPGFIEITVRDTGCGMPPEILEKILDPYFTTKPEGTGLGLAIVHKIVDEHDGAIRFASRLHEGTTVTISLPVG